MNIKEKNTGQMEKTLEALALEIDAAAEDGDISALDTLLDKCSSGLEAATGQNRVIFLFFEANCHSALAPMHSRDSDYQWSWRQDERVSEILSLRRAVSEQGFSKLEPIFQCKILTNLGNILNHLGRFVEAIKSWNAALQITPNSAMALGNKGIGLIHYGQSLYDHGHTGILTAHAKDDLNINSAAKYRDKAS